MTPQQLRAHGLLNGQTLLPEWVPVAKLNAEGDKLYTEASKLNAEGDKLYAEARKLYTEGDKLHTEASKLWRAAVSKELGASMTIHWTSDGCRLGNGEVYRYDD